LARDRQLISDLYHDGRIQADIAKETGLSQATVSRDIKALQRDWLKSALIDFDKAKARELSKIDNLERIYRKAWERSCEDAETTTQKMVGDPKTGRKEMSKTAKGQVGDPRFLQGIQWCIDRRCKILGVDAPTKIAPTDPTGTKEYALSDRERTMRIAALLGAQQDE